MCKFCQEHGRGDRWYLNYENYLFNKVFPTPEQRQEAKSEMMSFYSEIEWHHTDKEYQGNIDFIKGRGDAGLVCGQVVTLEETLRVFELANEAARREDSMVVLGHCPCREVYRGVRDYCCIGFGFPVALSMEIGYARLPREGLTEFGGADWRDLRSWIRKGVKVPLKPEEVEEVLRDQEKKGRYHMVIVRGRMPLIEGICNCEKPVCVYARYRQVYRSYEYLYKGHFVAQVDTSKCTLCRACMGACQFGAVYVSKVHETTTIDPLTCFGCGLCRAACKPGAISLVPRAKTPVARDLW